jgi:hypothetical protein
MGHDGSVLTSRFCMFKRVRSSTQVSFIDEAQAEAVRFLREPVTLQRRVENVGPLVSAPDQARRVSVMVDASCLCRGSLLLLRRYTGWRSAISAICSSRPACTAR